MTQPLIWLQCPRVWNVKRVRDIAPVVERMRDASIWILGPTNTQDALARNAFDKVRPPAILAYPGSSIDDHLRYYPSLNLANTTVITIPPIEAITAVAEHAIGLLVALTRDYGKIKVGDGWVRDNHIPPFMISRKRVVVVGAGRIGHRLFSILSAMSRDVMLVKEDAVPEKNWDIMMICARRESGFRLTRRYMHNPEEKTVINIAHADAVDELDVLDAIIQGMLYAADVCRLDYGSVSPLWNRFRDGERRLLMSPHIGGTTKDAYAHAQAALLDRIWDEINGWER